MATRPLVLALASLSACADPTSSGLPADGPSGSSADHVVTDDGGFLSGHVGGAAAFAENDPVCGTADGIASYSQPQEMLDLPVHVMVARPINPGPSDWWPGQPWVDDHLADVNALLAQAMIRLVPDGPLVEISDDDLYSLDADQFDEAVAAHGSTGAVDLLLVDELFMISDGDKIGLNGVGFFPWMGLPAERGLAIATYAPVSTWPHELGHYLALLHTHETAQGVDLDGTRCRTAGDGLCDTPPDPGPCPSDADFCCEDVPAQGCGALTCYDQTASPAQATDTLDPQATNLMSYYDRECRDLYSGEQIGRMRCFLERGAIDSIDLTLPPSCVDQDHDGYGEGSTCIDVDCDDNEPRAHIGTVEVCDGVDNDCNGAVDEGKTIELYADFDADGFGDPDTPLDACAWARPPGFVSDRTDCDDADYLVHPGATELCNGVDDDCNGQPDDPRDHDGDGQRTCEGDCDDDDPAIFRDAPEPCGAIVDTNCDGSLRTCPRDCFDPDGDGFGTGCPAGPDCDSTTADVFPGRFEQCDGVDNNCNGSVDEGVIPTWYLDQDGDGFGLATDTRHACVRPEGHAEQPGDCDDGAAGVFPGATEQCNAMDDNCDGIGDLDCGIRMKVVSLHADPGGSAHISIPLPVNAIDWIAFIAPEDMIEHDSDRCDWVTDIHEAAGTVSFTLTTDHCGDRFDEGGVTAKAVVMATTNADGWLMARDLDGGHGATGTGSWSIPTGVTETQAFATCSWQTFVDDGDQNDTTRSCSVDARWASGVIDASASTANDGCANGTVRFDTRILAFGLTANIVAERQEPVCHMDGDVGFEHLLGPGADHAVIVLPQMIATNDCNDHGSFWTTCDQGPEATLCGIDCHGSQNWVDADVLFFDGDFDY